MTFGRSALNSDDRGPGRQPQVLFRLRQRRRFHAGHWPQAAFNYAHLPLWIGLWGTGCGVVAIAYYEAVNQRGTGESLATTVMIISAALYTTALSVMAAAARHREPVAANAVGKAPPDGIHHDKPRVTPSLLGRYAAVTLTTSILTLALLVIAPPARALPVIIAMLMWAGGNATRLLPTASTG